MRILVTGGAGFIGSALVRHLIAKGEDFVCNFDKLTYAGNLASLKDVEACGRYRFVQGDICDAEHVAKVLEECRIEAIVHLAAESHVDRSIDGPEVFVHTNVVGTFRLLSEARRYWQGLPRDRQQAFRFHHVSTDEVFGDLPFDTGVFTEQTPYNPSSPYSASKASSDHFVRAWHDTYGLPIVLSNCSNNYGPYQYPEKLIPLVLLNALEGRELPIYGKGENVRDWLHVEDHARALEQILKRGRIGRSYNVGGRAERSNIDVVRQICRVLDEVRPRQDGRSYMEQIAFVTDRPGHDRRYAIDPARIEDELGWRASHTFESGLEETIAWYLRNEWWWKPLRSVDAGTRRGLK